MQRSSAQLTKQRPYGAPFGHRFRGEKALPVSIELDCVISLTPTARCPCEALGMQTNDHQQDWRARAEEMRAIGNQMHDQLAREEMLRLANKYERLAAWTEELSPLLRQ
jgi:hypothetical protein